MALSRRSFLRNATLGIGAVVSGNLLAACGAPQGGASSAAGQQAGDVKGNTLPGGVWGGDGLGCLAGVHRQLR